METFPSVMILACLLLLICSAIASSIETAVSSSSKVKLQNLADNGNKKAELALRLKEIQQKVISAALIMNNVVNVSLSTVATLLFTRYFENIPIAILTGTLTFILLIYGEIMPKSLATKYPEEYFVFFVNVINIFTIVLTPIIKILNFITNIFLRPFHTNVESMDNIVTEEELKTMVNISHEEGVIESEEKEIIHNVFEFGELTLKDIMIPRVDMVVVDINASYDELLKVFNEERYTRVPVYEETVDNVVGIVILKDFFMYNKDKSKFKIKDIMREAYFLYENKKVMDTLTEMQKTSNNFVIVLDEYGSTAGMVTLEDILEEIVGDIKDEFDEDEEKEIVEVSKNVYLIEGAVKIDDINEKLGTDLQNDEFDSIGGLIVSSIGNVPTVGEEVDYAGYKLKVVKMDNNRIAKVKLTVPENLEKNEKE